MLDKINKLTHSMRLLGIHESAQRRSQQAVADQLHPLEFLRLILEDEVLFRKDKISKSLSTRAKFQFDANIEDWDTTYDRGITKNKLRELSLLNFYHNKENLLIVGSTGVGKTQLGIALGKRLCHEGFQVHFLSVNMTFEDIRLQKLSGKYIQLVKKINKANLIILDDFGLRNYSHEEAVILMDILEGRYGKHPLIVTSQVDPKGWLKLFEDQVIAEALVDRLIHPSQTIVLQGVTYREKAQNKNKT
jgi:DNA replication protein DnaC